MHYLAETTVMIHSRILQRYRRLKLSAHVFKTTGSAESVAPFLRQQEDELQKLGTEMRDLAVQATTHAIDSNNFVVLATVIMQIGFSIALAAFQYKTLGENAGKYTESAQTLLEDAAEIFIALGDEGNQSYAENNLAIFWWMMSDKEKAQQHAKKALELSIKSGVKFVETRSSDILQQLERGILPSNVTEKVDHSPEQQEKMLRYMVRELGIDIDNPKNDIDNAVRVGIKDLNPERVLKFCECIAVNQINTSEVGKMIGVSTVGPKLVGCVKFGYGFEGFDLDKAFQSLKQFHCDSCKYKRPRSVTWEWSFEWERNKRREYDTIMRNS